MYALSGSSVRIEELDSAFAPETEGGLRQRKAELREQEREAEEKWRQKALACDSDSVSVPLEVYEFAGRPQTRVGSSTTGRRSSRSSTWTVRSG